MEEGTDTESITIVNMAELFMFIGGFSICFCTILTPKAEKFWESAKEKREMKRNQDRHRYSSDENQRHMNDLLNEEELNEMDKDGATKPPQQKNE